MKKYCKYVKANPWGPVYSAAPPPVDPAPDVPPVADPPMPESSKVPPPRPTPDTFTQEQFNAALAKDRREHKAQQQVLLDELTSLKAGGINAEYEAKMEELQGTLLTKDELAKKATEKASKKHEDQIAELTKNYNNLNTKYTHETITRALTDAAVTGKAVSPEQLVAILGQTTRLAEVLDDAGQPTGQLIPKIKFEDTDKDGKSVTLDLTPPEAVKRMKEMDKYLNLFSAEGTAGLGGHNRSGGEAPDLRELAKDPAAYAKARKEGKITL